MACPRHQPAETSARSTTRKRRPTNARSRRKPFWADYGTEDLLNLRLCDLGIQLDQTPLMDLVAKLYQELADRDVRFRPNVWLSSEWFAADGVPGIAVPFYLAHPRLMQLEKKMMLQVEGGKRDECLKILRHEAGHAVDTAYRLHFKKLWRETFGSFREPYPDYYQPRPASRHYVLHLRGWYAQSHPAEDFAETFAVWLNPRSRWRQVYQGWPAMRKLEAVDELMNRIAGRRPVVQSRRRVEPLRRIRQTLRDHYQEKRRRYIEEWPDFYDRDLRRLFSDEPRYARRPSAAQFLRRSRPEIREKVAAFTGVHAYTIDQLIRDMIDRCAELKLRLAQPTSQTRHDAMMMVTVATMNFVHSRQHWIPL